MDIAAAQHTGFFPPWAVLVARDRFLKADGLMLPATAELFMVPVQAQQTYDGQVSTDANQLGGTCNNSV